MTLLPVSRLLTSACSRPPKLRESSEIFTRLRRWLVAAADAQTVGLHLAIGGEYGQAKLCHQTNKRGI